MKITPKEFESLYSENITKKDYDRIIAKIAQRVDQIIRTIASKLKWWDFDNEPGDADLGTGHFDPDEYKLEIRLHGEFDCPRPYTNSFPTSWLYEDNYLEQFKLGVAEYNKFGTIKKKQGIRAKKIKNAKKNELRESIMAKLTPEECKIIKFK